MTPHSHRLKAKEAIFQLVTGPNRRVAFPMHLSSEYSSLKCSAGSVALHNRSGQRATCPPCRSSLQNVVSTELNRQQVRGSDGPRQAEPTPLIKRG